MQQQEFGQLPEEKKPGLSLWAGPECTIVRLGDQWRSQVHETGHLHRIEDLDLLPQLGVKSVRYPLLWEQIAPVSTDDCNFGWSDERLARLRELDIDVVAGLLHHGSGPAYTNLLDPDFPQKFAQYASRVAQRYPWIKTWTPINEPLTTARFSALYGHWYPHKTDFNAFARALVNQCLGIAMAMTAIKNVNPSAKLLLTEDIGKTFSTSPLDYQANYENERRWLSFDLLCGRMVRGHDFYKRLIYAGISAYDLDQLAEEQARPDILGVNHYLTSERFLDHRTELYPGVPTGGNEHEAYVDVEAVRNPDLVDEIGIYRRLKETWERYALPLVVTEVHHGCTRDEQVRWLSQVWEETLQAQKGGVDVSAVTVWSLYGAYDWRSLLTRHENHYDVGAFDLRAENARPTLIAEAAHSLSKSGTFDHPVLDKPGWWKRDTAGLGNRHLTGTLCMDPRKIWITGATGSLGQAFARICAVRGLDYVITSRDDCNISDAQSVAAAMSEIRPWAVINAAGYVKVDAAEHNIEECMRANADGAGRLAEACTHAGIALTTFSSDLVFDGQQGPYSEHDIANPQSVYGRSKLMAEQAVCAAGRDHLVIRTSAFFGPWDIYNFAFHTAQQLARNHAVNASRQTVVSPTFLPDLCHSTLDLLMDRTTGIIHLSNTGEYSWLDLANKVAAVCGYDPVATEDETSAVLSNTALVSKRFAGMRPFEMALKDWHYDMFGPGAEKGRSPSQQKALAR